MINIIKKQIKEKTVKKSFKFNKKSSAFSQKTKKRDAPGRLYKSSTENMPYFNRNRIFSICKLAQIENGTYLYWLEEDGQKVKGRFLRQELFALSNQFVQWGHILFILKK